MSLLQVQKQLTLSSSLAILSCSLSYKLEGQQKFFSSTYQQNSIFKTICFNEKIPLNLTPVFFFWHLLVPSVKFKYKPMIRTIFQHFNSFNVTRIGSLLSFPHVSADFFELFQLRLNDLCLLSHVSSKQDAPFRKNTDTSKSLSNTAIILTILHTLCQINVSSRCVSP